eukprot:428903-Hanusia_phi.AAC.2
MSGPFASGNSKSALFAHPLLPRLQGSRFFAGRPRRHKLSWALARGGTRFRPARVSKKPGPGHGLARGVTPSSAARA